MAFARLNAFAAPWYGSGVRYLLSPDDLPPEWSACALPGTAPALTPLRGTPPSRPARPAAPFARPARPQRESPPEAQSARKAPPPRPEASPAAASAPRPAVSRAVWQPLAQQQWPQLWRDRLPLTRPGRVGWTYRHLGADLLGNGPDEPGVDAPCTMQDRREFFRRMICDLAYPAGTHTFWPVCMPLSAAPDAPEQESAEAFWAGLRLLRARGVVIMGSAAAKAAGLPGGLRPLESLFFRGFRVLILWDLSNLVRQEQRYASILAFLRSSLQPLLPR